jgi:glucose-6-phosphate isomerase
MLKIDFSNVSSNILTESEALKSKAENIKKEILSGKFDMTGWRDVRKYSDISEIKELANDINKKSDIVVSIGIGGSYIGIKAGLEFISKEFQNENTPEILFAGFNLSSDYHNELLKKIEGKDFSVVVISKSGTTIEPAFVFEIFKEKLIEKYGEEEAYQRIVAITDKEKGTLKEEANKNKYKTLVVPDDVGGRFSILTPVGLLVFAIKGIDISKLIQPIDVSDDLIKLACIRATLTLQKKPAELLASYEPSFQTFTDWLVQLYGESEGKDGKGMFPVPALFTRDLHSIGQFLQDGSPIFLETMLSLEDGGELKGEKFSMFELNEAARKGVITAHKNRGTEIISIFIKDRSPETFGFAVQFFEWATALTGFLISVFPFDQPGVEAYKSEMKKLLV